MKNDDKVKSTDEKEDFCPTRQTLLLRVKNMHDEKSWEEFVFYYEKFIYIICRRMGLFHHDSEEVVQKVILKLWKALPDYDYSEGKRFRSWLCKVTGNTVKDFFRSNKRAQVRKTKAADYEIWNPDSSSSPDIEVKIQKEWEHYISNIALENIKSHFTEKIIEIFHLANQGKSMKELSEELDIPINTIYVYNHRVTNKLQDEIRRLSKELG